MISYYLPNPTSEYILIVTTNGAGAASYPQGDLSTFLNNYGASTGLAVAEQIAEDAGSAAGNEFNYVLYFCKPFNVKVGDGAFDE